MRHPPKEFYCTTCGGTDIQAEAYCYWDSAAQTWAYYEVVEEGYDYCETCMDQTTGSFRPVTDVKTLAQIAIKREERNAATQNA